MKLLILSKLLEYIKENSFNVTDMFTPIYINKSVYCNTTVCWAYLVALMDRVTRKILVSRSHFNNLISYVCPVNAQ